MADGFWGVDDGGISGNEATGIREGKGGRRGAPSEAKTAPHGRVTVSGDRVGMLVDMDARTLTMPDIRGQCGRPHCVQLPRKTK